MPKGKRTYGSGTIYSVNPDDYTTKGGKREAKAKQVGPFEGYLRKMVGGKRVSSPSFSGASKREIQLKIEGWLAQGGFDKVQAKADTLTFGTYVESWFNSTAKTWADTTKMTNTSIYNRYLASSSMHNLDIRKMTTDDVEAFLNRMPPTVSGNVKRSILKLIGQASRQAMRRKIVSADLSKIEQRPKASKSQVVHFHPEHEGRLSCYVMGDTFWEAVVLVAFDAGLREQELLGLQWSSVDLTGGVLHVEHALNDLRGTPTLTTTLKTETSRRPITLSADTLGALERLRRAGKGLCGYVFHDDGKPWERSKFYRRWLRLLERAGVPRYSPYSARHTMATRLLAGGAFLNDVAARMGHAKPSMTADIYAHAIPGGQSRLASAYGASLAQYRSGISESQPVPEIGSPIGSPALETAA